LVNTVVQAGTRRYGGTNWDTLAAPRLLASCSGESFIFGKFVRVSSKVAALRTLSAPVILSAGELVLFAEVAPAIEGILPFRRRGGPAARGASPLAA